MTFELLKVCRQANPAWIELRVMYVRSTVTDRHARWGTYKVRNEIETKRNETKRNQRKRNETKRNQRNKTKPTKAKRNRLIWEKKNKKKDNYFVSFRFVSFLFRFALYRYPYQFRILPSSANYSKKFTMD
jgi:hypothetical protein